jgi:hypothetical protein
MIGENSLAVRPIVTDAEEADYLAYLGKAPGALLYYGLKFRKLLTTLLECEARYWIAYEAGMPAGILPTVTKIGPHGAVINSLAYFGSHGGVLATSYAARCALIDAYKRQMSNPNVLSATLIENPLIPELEPPPHQIVDRRISQMTPLHRDDPMRFLSTIDSSARRNIRKAEQSGVDVRIENQAIDFLWGLHVANMSAIGGLAKTKQFFELLPQIFESGKDYRIWTAWRSGRRIAALLTFYAGDTVEYFTPATIAAERENQPMAAILRTAMTEAAREGFSRWNWGGTWPMQTGVYRFKKKWGAVDREYKYFTTVGDERLFDMDRESLMSAYPGFFVVPFLMLRGN